MISRNVFLGGDSSVAMSSPGTAQASFAPAKPSLRAAPPLSVRLAQQKYFRQINTRPRPRKEMPHNFPEAWASARQNGAAPHRSQVALLKTNFTSTEQNAKIPDQIAIDQAVATLLAHMDDYDSRKQYIAGQMIGEKLVAQIIQTDIADTLEALRRALLLDEIRNAPAVRYAFRFGIPFPLDMQAVERATERFSPLPEDLPAERGINYILSGNFLQKLNDMPKGAPISVGGQSYSKEAVIDAVNAVRNNPELKEMGPQAQMIALSARLAASKISQKHGPKDPDAIVRAFTELPEDTKLELKNNGADIDKVAKQLNHNFCRASGNYNACRAETKEQLSPENLSKMVKALETLDAAAKSPAPSSGLTQPHASNTANGVSI